MKSKTEFYKAFFEGLDKKGFIVKEPSSPDYIADIYQKDKLIAFFTKQDAVLKNPFIEASEKLIERVQAMAETTAIACGICSDKPYEDDKITQDKNKVVKINEHNNVVLACKHHPLFHYVLSTYRMDRENNNTPMQRQYFYNKEEAFESFATRSGLVDEKKLFSETDLKIIHAGLVKMRTIDEDLSHDDMDSVERLVDKIEDILPELYKKEKAFEFSKMFNFFDVGMERE